MIYNCMAFVQAYRALFFSLLLNSAAAAALEGFTVKKIAEKFHVILRWNGKSLAWDIEKEKKQLAPLNLVVRLLISPARNLVCQIAYGMANKLPLCRKLSSKTL